MRFAWWIPALVSVLATACGGSDAHPDAPPPPIDAGPVAIQLRFDRPAGGVDFDAIATWVDATGAPIAGPDLALTVDHGTIASPTADGTGVRARVTTGASGLFAVTATAGAMSVTHTAVVLGAVDDTWNQPELVRGLVNTPGWEDGASISPDGQTLILQYLPVPINCLLSGHASDPSCKVTGPIGAPERPNMPGANRVNADGTYNNACPSLGITTLPDTILVPPDGEWAFSRAADGSFDQPRALFYDGADGCFSSFGLMIGPDGKTVTWAFDSPLPPDDGAKLRTGVLDLSTTTVLGTFSSPGGALTLTGEPGAPIPLGESAPEGNPYLAALPDGRRLVLFDDEGGRRDLLFSEETAPASNTWTAPALIPAPVSADGPQESQPFLDGMTLLFRRELVVLASDWNGGPLGDAASWSEPRPILTPAADVPDAIIVTGEPSVATTATGRELYFVYGQHFASGTLDLGVAMVPAR